SGGGHLGAVRQPERAGVRARERPLVRKRPAVADEALDDVVGVAERAQVPGEPFADRVQPFEEAVVHPLHGVLCVQIHARVEIARVVPLHVPLQELPVRLHRCLLSDQTCFGTCPPYRTRMTLWPRSAVGSNISGQPPSITVMPCSRPYWVAL